MGLQLLRLEEIGAMVRVPTDLAIDAVLSANLDTNLLGPFSSTEENVEPLRFRKAIYISAPFVRFLLERDLIRV